jgi:hypothetical protein
MMKAFHFPHTRALKPLKEFTSKVVVDKVVEHIMVTRISGETNLGVISIVDNEGLEVKKDHVEVPKKEVTTIPRNLDIDFLCKETKVGSREVNEANDDGAFTQEEIRYGGGLNPRSPPFRSPYHWMKTPNHHPKTLSHHLRTPIYHLWTTQPPLEDIEPPLEDTPSTTCGHPTTTQRHRTTT